MSKKNGIGQLTEFLIERFSVGELERIIGGDQGLRKLMSGITWRDTLANVAASIATLAHQHGLGSSLFNALASERPLLKKEIAKIREYWSLHEDPEIESKKLPDDRRSRVSTSARRVLASVLALGLGGASGALFATTVLSSPPKPTVDSSELPPCSPSVLRRAAARSFFRPLIKATRTEAPETHGEPIAQVVPVAPEDRTETLTAEHCVYQDLAGPGVEYLDVKVNSPITGKQWYVRAPANQRSDAVAERIYRYVMLGFAVGDPIALLPNRGQRFGFRVVGSDEIISQQLLAEALDSPEGSGAGVPAPSRIGNATTSASPPMIEIVVISSKSSGETPSVRIGAPVSEVWSLDFSEYGACDGSRIWATTEDETAALLLQTPDLDGDEIYSFVEDEIELTLVFGEDMGVDHCGLTREDSPETDVRMRAITGSVEFELDPCESSDAPDDELECATVSLRDVVLRVEDGQRLADKENLEMELGLSELVFDEVPLITVENPPLEMGELALGR